MSADKKVASDVPPRYLLLGCLLPKLVLYFKLMKMKKKQKKTMVIALIMKVKFHFFLILKKNKQLNKQRSKLCGCLAKYIDGKQFKTYW